MTKPSRTTALILSTMQASLSPLRKPALLCATPKHFRKYCRRRRGALRRRSAKSGTYLRRDSSELYLSGELKDAGRRGTRNQPARRRTDSAGDNLVAARTSDQQ